MHGQGQGSLTGYGASAIAGGNHAGDGYEPALGLDIDGFRAAVKEVLQEAPTPKGTPRPEREKKGAAPGSMAERQRQFFAGRSSSVGPGTGSEEGGEGRGIARRNSSIDRRSSFTANASMPQRRPSIMDAMYRPWKSKAEVKRRDLPSVMFFQVRPRVT